MALSPTVPSTKKDSPGRVAKMDATCHVDAYNIQNSNYTTAGLSSVSKSTDALFIAQLMAISDAQTIFECRPTP